MSPKKRQSDFGKKIFVTHHYQLNSICRFRRGRGRL
jgi:hypothetical protein